MSGTVEVYRAGARGWGYRHRSGDGSTVAGLTKTGFATREAAKAGARESIVEAKRRGLLTEAGDHVPARRPTPATATAARSAERTTPTGDEVARIAREVMSRPDIQAAIVEYQRREGDTAVRDAVRRRVGPELAEDSQVGSFLEQHLDEITARATGVLRESDGSEIPRAPTRRPDRVQQPAVDWLVAQSAARGEARLEAHRQLFPERP